jgi:hypothetical protein
MAIGVLLNTLHTFEAPSCKTQPPYLRTGRQLNKRPGRLEGAIAAKSKTKHALFVVRTQGSGICVLRAVSAPLQHPNRNRSTVQRGKAGAKLGRKRNDQTALAINQEQQPIVPWQRRPAGPTTEQ